MAVVQYHKLIMFIVKVCVVSNDRRSRLDVQRLRRNFFTGERIVLTIVQVTAYGLACEQGFNCYQLFSVSRLSFQRQPQAPSILSLTTKKKTIEINCFEKGDCHRP